MRTLQRHFARVGLNVRADGRTPDKVYGRFEASARNELWTGDGLHGPKIGGRTAVLLAFIDDYSRTLVGYRWGTAEDVLRLEAALRSGLLARGVPDGILVDRGSAFVSHQLLRACAVLGVRLIHASPRAATTKGKIERFFRTVRGQFLVELAKREVADLAELNRLFAAWVETVYHRRAHSETGQPPIERFLAAGPPQLPAPELLREAFLWQETRTVTKTATVSLHGNQYEVDAALAHRRCELIFDPFDLTRIEVRYQDRPLGLAVPSGSAVTFTRKPSTAHAARAGDRDRLPRADPRNGGAAGADGVSIEQFEGDLSGNLYRLWNRMVSGSYFPGAVRAVEIPKKGKKGGIRVLGIPNVVDRVAQAAAAAALGSSVEPVFHEDSYGYRPGRSPVDAVRVCRERCLGRTGLLILTSGPSLTPFRGS